MQSPPSDVIRGTLDLLVLQTLTLEPMHGWGISQRLPHVSSGALGVHPGSPVPARPAPVPGKRKGGGNVSRPAPFFVKL